MIKILTAVNFADVAVKSDSLFRLIRQSGDDTSPGERGLLLYKGGNVCDEDFSYYSASAICREMGYKQASHWTTVDFSPDDNYQDTRFNITPSKVVCDNEDWKSCFYSTDTIDCDPFEDVMLTCTGSCFYTSTILI